MILNFQNAAFYSLLETSTLFCSLTMLFVQQVNGIKGYSLVIALEHHSIIPGYVIDYMHGALLGVTKTMLTLWFSSSKDNKGKDFFIGDQVCHIKYC